MSFPSISGFTAREDSSLFSKKLVNPAIRKELEGGFVSTRRRYTRTVYEITTGFTNISHADHLLFEAFVAAVGGGAGSFTYINPVTSESLTVRFKDTPTASYAGLGGVHRWDYKDIKLETV